MFAARNLSGCWGKALQELCSMQHSRLIFFCMCIKRIDLTPPLTFLQSQTSTKTYFLLVKISDPPLPPPDTSDLLPTPLKRRTEITCIVN